MPIGSDAVAVQRIHFVVNFVTSIEVSMVIIDHAFDTCSSNCNISVQRPTKAIKHSITNWKVYTAD